MDTKPHIRSLVMQADPMQADPIIALRPSPLHPSNSSHQQPYRDIRQVPRDGRVAPKHDAEGPGRGRADVVRETGGIFGCARCHHLRGRCHDK